LVELLILQIQDTQPTSLLVMELLRAIRM